MLLRHLFLELEGRKSAKSQGIKQRHQAAIDALTGDGSPYAACMRAFSRLYHADPVKARQYADGCLKYIDTTSLRQALS